MNFICDPCKKGADLPTEIFNNAEGINELKRLNHDECKGGTWCDCQCRVGRKNV